MYWTKRARELEHDWVKLQIENNDYYYRLKNVDEGLIWHIVDYWNDSCENYSLYTLLDSIVNYMDDNAIDDVWDVLDDDDFEII